MVGRGRKCHPARHRASHAERPNRTHRTAPARTRHPPQVRGVLSGPQLAAARSEPGSSNPCAAASTGSPVRPTPGDSHSWPHASLARAPTRVVPVGGARCGTWRASRATSSRSRYRDPTRSTRGRHRAREHGHRPRHLGIVDRFPSRPPPARCAISPRSTRPWIVERAVDEALRRRLVDLTDPRTRRRRPRGSRATALHRHARDPRAPGSGLPPRRERSREARSPSLLERAGLPRPTSQHRVRVGAKTDPHRSLLPGAADRDRVRRLGASTGRGRPSTTTAPVATTSYLLGFQRAPLHVTIGRSADRRHRCAAALDSSICQLRCAYVSVLTDVRRGRAGRGQVMQSAPRRMRSSA